MTTRLRGLALLLCAAARNALPALIAACRAAEIAIDAAQAHAKHAEQIHDCGGEDYCDATSHAWDEAREALERAAAGGEVTTWVREAALRAAKRTSRGDRR